MNKLAVKDSLYGAIAEMMNDPMFYYKSSAGAQFSHWTDIGKVELAQLMNIMSPVIDQVERDHQAFLAKTFVFATLKGES